MTKIKVMLIIILFANTTCMDSVLNRHVTRTFESLRGCMKIIGGGGCNILIFILAKGGLVCFTCESRFLFCLSPHL